VDNYSEKKTKQTKTFLEIVSSSLSLSPPLRPHFFFLFARILPRARTNISAVNDD